MNFPHSSGHSTFRYFTMSTSALDNWPSCRRPFILHRRAHSMLIDLNQRQAVTPAVFILGEVNRLEQQASNRQTVLHHFCKVFRKESYKCSYFLNFFHRLLLDRLYKIRWYSKKQKLVDQSQLPEPELLWWVVLGKCASVYCIWSMSVASTVKSRHSAGRWHNIVIY